MTDGFWTPDGYELRVIGNPTDHLGIAADFGEYFRTIGGLNSVAPEPRQLDSRTYNFLFGPEVKSRNRNTRFTPFAHALFGLQHVNATFRQGGVMPLEQTVSNNAFAMGHCVRQRRGFLEVPNLA